MAVANGSAQKPPQAERIHGEEDRGEVPVADGASCMDWRVGQKGDVFAHLLVSLRHDASAKLTSSLLAAPEKTLSRETRSERETGKENERSSGAIEQDSRAR
jgi:hypothetical protein